MWQYKRDTVIIMISFESCDWKSGQAPKSFWLMFLRYYYDGLLTNIVIVCVATHELLLRENGKEYKRRYVVLVFVLRSVLVSATTMYCCFCESSWWCPVNFYEWSLFSSTFPHKHALFLCRRTALLHLYCLFVYFSVIKLVSDNLLLLTKQFYYAVFSSWS